MTWYRVRTYGLEITPVEVVKETNSFITIREKDWEGKPKEYRTAKHSGYERNFESFEDAKKHIIGRLLVRIDTAEQQIQEAKRELAKAECLVKP
jgi:hypothetical protein